MHAQFYSSDHECPHKYQLLFQQSKKLAAIRSSKAISGCMGNSGISVLLFVYLTLYEKYIQTFSSTWDLKRKRMRNHQYILHNSSLKMKSSEV